MGCNCKTEKGIDGLVGLDSSDINIKKASVGSYILKVITFLFFLVVLPIIMVGIIWIVFKMLVLNKSVDIKPLLMSVGSLGMPKEEEEDDDEYSNLTEDDVVMVDVEELTPRSK